IQRNLNTYRQYCDNAADLINDAAEKTPGAAQILERGLPIIDKQIKEIIREIQEKTRTICQESKDTPTEDLACTISQETQKWQIGDPEQMTQNVENLIFSLKTKIPKIPENKPIYDKIEKIKNETDLTKQYETICILIALIPTTTVHTGDNINLSNVTASEKSQIVVKGTGNKNIDTNASPTKNTAQKSIINRINAPATFAAFIGFVISEIGTSFHPTTYNHLISVLLAMIVFTLVAVFNKQ
ncbi:hypothetical protein DRN85_01625, partial [Methanosarcinales archaeon]